MSLDERSTPTIRLMTADDFETTWRLFHRLSLDWALGPPPTEEQTREHVRNNTLGELSDVRIALALEDEEAVGMAVFAILYPSPNRRGQLYLKELFVDVEQRGKGIGRTLMAFVARYALKHGCNRLDWTTETSNPKALAFYRALGARPLKEKVYFRLADDELITFADRGKLPPE